MAQDNTKTMIQAQIDIDMMIAIEDIVKHGNLGKGKGLGYHNKSELVRKAINELILREEQSGYEQTPINIKLISGVSSSASLMNKDTDLIKKEAQDLNKRPWTS